MVEKPRLLVLLSRVPYPLDKGDKLRAYHQIKGISQSFRIILVCLSAEKIDSKAIVELEKYCEKIEIIRLNKMGILWRLFIGYFSDLPFQVLYFKSKNAQKKIDLLIEKYTPKRFYCQLIRVTEYTIKYSIFNKTLDYMDALSIGMKRRLENAPFYLKPLIAAEYNRLITYENKMFKHFEQKIIISGQDKEYIAHQNTDEIEVVANGIDFEYWKPEKTAKKYDVVFTGNMSYPPNVEGALYIVKEVLPILKKAKPSIQILICGKNPSSSVRRLANENVTVTGWVEDIRTAYNNSKVFFAPMALGSGLQNKLLEAMCMQLPCVTSELANKALSASPNKEILIGKSPEEYAKHILALLDNQEQSDTLALNGKKYVEANFDWMVLNQRLVSIISGKD